MPRAIPWPFPQKDAVIHRVLGTWLKENPPFTSFDLVEISVTGAFNGQVGSPPATMRLFVGDPLTEKDHKDNVGVGTSAQLGAVDANGLGQVVEIRIDGQADRDPNTLNWVAIGGPKNADTCHSGLESWHELISKTKLHTIQGGGKVYKLRFRMARLNNTDEVLVTFDLPEPP